MPEAVWGSEEREEKGEERGAWGTPRDVEERPKERYTVMSRLSSGCCTSASVMTAIVFVFF